MERELMRKSPAVKVNQDNDAFAVFEPVFSGCFDSVTGQDESKLNDLELNIFQLADSGLSNGNAQIFLAEILPTADISLSEEEGIVGFQWIGEEQFRQMIREGEITDGFTLSAYARLLSAGV